MSGKKLLGDRPWKIGTFARVPIPYDMKQKYLKYEIIPLAYGMMQKDLKHEKFIWYEEIDCFPLIYAVDQARP